MNPWRTAARWRFPICVMAVVWLTCCQAEAAPLTNAPAASNESLAQRRERGEKFLIELFDDSMALLPEFRGSQTFWLFHDNYLAAKLLNRARPDLAARIRASIARFGVTRSGKIEILFGESPQPLPFCHYQLTNVAVAAGRTIRTEVVTSRSLDGWERYADLLLFAALAQAESAPEKAQVHFQAALAMWDGTGFRDEVVKKHERFATYKLALFLLADTRLRSKAAIRTAVLQRLSSLQHSSGGWITDYQPDGQPHGLANVETTCLAMLALAESPP